MPLIRCFVSIIPPENDGFMGKTILQGSVATRLRCGRIVCDHLTTNFMQNPSMKEFRKSVKIRQSYHEKFDAPFLGHSVVHHSRNSPVYINYSGSCTALLVVA